MDESDGVETGLELRVLVSSSYINLRVFLKFINGNVSHFLIP